MSLSTTSSTLYKGPSDRSTTFSLPLVRDLQNPDQVNPSASMAEDQGSKPTTPHNISEAESGENLTADEIQLRARGHKGELPRQFSAFAMLAVAFSITNSWIGYSAAFITPLFDGGGPTVFWGLIVAAFACSCISKSPRRPEYFMSKTD